MPITAAEASAHIQSMNARKRRLLPAFINDNVKPVYIFNIYQKMHRVILGSLGTYHIPACEGGKPYSEPLVIPGIFGEEFDLADGQGNMASNPIPGIEIAKNVVGCQGSDRNVLTMLTNNLEWQGVFIATGTEPTKKELESARSKLIQYATMMLKDGDRLHAENSRHEYFRPLEIHREFASFLKQNRDWNAEPEQRTDCPACGTNIRPNLAVCPSCNAVLDIQKAAQFFPEKYGNLSNVPRGTKETVKTA